MQRQNHNWHNISIEKSCEILDVNIDKGLNWKQIEQRQKKFGLNNLPEEKSFPRLKIFLGQLKSPLIYILIIAGFITLSLKKWSDAIVIFAVVALNTAVGYFQERKASKALKELKKVLKIKAICLRDEKEIEIDQEDLVPGDVIILRAGSKVPADGRIIKSSNLKINEATLTGEWLAAKKNSDILPLDTPLADRNNMVYMGTIVEDGEGKVLITETGINTEIGKIAVLVKETKEEKTPYQKKLAHLSKIVGITISFICFFIFIQGIITGREFIEMFSIAIALVVAAIPEGLPVAMTVILALGMQRILKNKGLVRKLISAETLGSTSIICTDKTLTLTQGKMSVDRIETDNKDLFWKIAVLCNEASIENPQELETFWKIRGRPTDKALVLAGHKAGFKKTEIERQFPLIDKISFNPQNKFIAAIHQDQKQKQNLLFISGAPEKIIKLCELDEEQSLKLFQRIEDLTKKGLRVIGLAYKETKEDKLEIKDINNLSFVGLVGLKDPLREEVKSAIKICQNAGIRFIIVTGDHVLTAKAVAEELGLEVKKENIIEGRELEKISEKDLERRLEKINIFARVEPEHKMRIVSAWQAKNEVVAMTGDGINDVPALHRADVGVSLGSGTEAAKEISDLVLLNDSFSIIVKAVEQGRVILDNIRKVILYLLTDTFTETVLISSSIIMGLPLPITAVQILWINLINDGFPNIALSFEPEEKDVIKQKPKDYNTPLLTKEMKVIILVVGIVANIILVGLLFWFWNKGMDLNYLRTLIFALLAFDSFFCVFSCRSLRRNIWQINPFSNKLLIISCLTGVVSLLAAIYLPAFNTLLGTVPLTRPSDWLFIIGLGIINIILIEGVKYYFIVKKKTKLT